MTRPAPSENTDTPTTPARTILYSVSGIEGSASAFDLASASTSVSASRLGRPGPSNSVVTETEVFAVGTTAINDWTPPLEWSYMPRSI